jgi:hypothetical protein
MSCQASRGHKKKQIPPRCNTRKKQSKRKTETRWAGIRRRQENSDEKNPQEQDHEEDSMSKRQDNTKGEQHWDNTCDEQGWNEESQLFLLKEFLKKKGLFREFAAYAKKAAKEENEQCLH